MRHVPSVRQASRRVTTVLATLITVLATGLATFALLGATAGPAQAAGNPVTPGNFTGYGFDQCHAPSQEAMDAWLTSSPYWAVGIYISGDSRFCRDQPNLTPTWVSTQLRNRWHLLPITLGPQASCTTRDRYLDQVRIDPRAQSSYAKARAQGRAEADKTIAASEALGIAPGSTQWYDIEAFDIGQTRCRESALSFLSSWTERLHERGYVSGIYSSAASGIRMLDQALTNRPGVYTMPDQVWIADWNKRDDVYSDYVRDTSWMPGGRVHQYLGGHNETHGGVTINIDRNFLDLGRGSQPGRVPRMCGARSDFTNYRWVGPGGTSATVPLAQCLLRRAGYYHGRIDGVFDEDLASAVSRYRSDHAIGHARTLSRRTWVALLSGGRTSLLKVGSANPTVRRVQRALNATSSHQQLEVSGVFDKPTDAAVRAYQARHDIAATGVVLEDTWALLQSGAR